MLNIFKLKPPIFYDRITNAEYRGKLVCQHHVMALALRVTLCAMKHDIQIGPAVCICVAIMKGMVVLTLMLLYFLVYGEIRTCEHVM